jgi:hypothetical protein
MRAVIPSSKGSRLNKHLADKAKRACAFYRAAVIFAVFEWDVQ